MLVKCALIVVAAMAAAALVDACAPQYQAYQRYNSGRGTKRRLASGAS